MADMEFHFPFAPHERVYKRSFLNDFGPSRLAIAVSLSIECLFMSIMSSLAVLVISIFSPVRLIFQPFLNYERHMSGDGVADADGRRPP